MSSFRNHHISDKNFQISGFTLEQIYVLSPVTIEETSVFIQKKINKTFCPIDLFDIRTFKPESLQKLAPFYCDLVNCFFMTGTFTECEEKLL